MDNSSINGYNAFVSLAHPVFNAGLGVSWEANEKEPGYFDLLSVLARDWEPAPAMGEVLFTQPILTQPGQDRWVLVVPVASLSRTLAALSSESIEIEHVYDY